jgi:cytochrome c oxidase cbb3-type subunit 2
MPHRQLGAVGQHTDTNTAAIYPAARAGEAQQGAEHYRSLGCVYCHTQQVRPEGYGSDIERGWGRRRTVSRDYIQDKTVMLGTMRTGPDLTNIGERQSDAAWHYRHLYNPQITSPGSIMPPHAFLFDVRTIGQAGRSTNALVLEGPFAPPVGQEVIPTRRAEQLVAYLRSLKSSGDLPEAPVKKEEAQ